MSVTPASTGAVSTPSVPRVATAPSSRPYTPAAAAAVGAPSAASGASMMTPPASPRSAPFPFRRPTPVHTSAQSGHVGSALGSSAAAGESAPAAVATPVAGQPAVTTNSPTPRRAINPFLNADPAQRSRRLARALVSDLVAYHPQKREEGLREGTLRQLFREDIKKSYEEYVDQVGREAAEGSPHFQDALNEILGAGRKLF